METIGELIDILSHFDRNIKVFIRDENGIKPIHLAIEELPKEIPDVLIATFQ